MKKPKYKVGDLLLDKQDKNYYDIFVIQKVHFMDEEPGLFVYVSEYYYYCTFYFDKDNHFLFSLEEVDLDDRYVKINIRDDNLKLLYG